MNKEITEDQLVTSVKRQTASRENGKLGGVKTAEGKSTSRMNALKHGILGSITTKYDFVDVFGLYESLAEEFGVETPSKQILVEQLALTLLKLSRCARAEAEILREELATSRTNGSQIEKLFGVGTTQCNPENKAKLSRSYFDRLEVIFDRYEPRLFNRMMHLLDTLKNFQNT